MTPDDTPAAAAPSVPATADALSGLQMPLVEAIETQRAVRRLHTDDVDDVLLLRLIELAQRAPTGGNRQNIAFVIVRDQAVRNRLGSLNRHGWFFLKRMYAARARRDPKFARLLKAVEWQADHFEELPVLVVACVTGGPVPAWPPILAGGYYSSSIPAVQNFLLAARAVGLGAALTGLSLYSTVRARRVLGLPWRVNPVAVIPVGWPRGRYGPTTRQPVGDVVHVDRWGNQPYKGGN